MNKTSNIPNDTTPLNNTRVKLKVCGMKHLDNIHDVAAIQPDYMGFIFYQKSPRNVTVPTPQLPVSIQKVGVFVNATIEIILDTIKEHHLSAIQLHGEEAPEYCLQLKEAIHTLKRPLRFSKPRRPTAIALWKVFGIKDTFDFNRLQPYEGIVDYFLFDTKGKAKGGNGYTFDWTVLQKYPSTTPFILSGGIGLEEVPSVIEFMKTPIAERLHAIDVNSKFEIEPGLKNIEKLKQFKKLLSIENKV